MLMADDKGCGDARPAIIKGFVFPLRDGVTNKNISNALTNLASNRLVVLYTVGGKPFFCFPTWSLHQRIRNVKPKYPGPEKADAPSPTDAANCGNPPQTAANCGLNPIQSESESNPNPKGNPTRARGTRFTPPTADEVEDFVKANGLTHVNPSRFVDFYTSNGWFVGKTPMKDWRAACRGWEHRSEQENQGAKPARVNPALDYEQRAHREADYSGLFINMSDPGGGKDP